MVCVLGMESYIAQPLNRLGDQYQVFAVTGVDAFLVHLLGSAQCHSSGDFAPQILLARVMKAVQIGIERVQHIYYDLQYKLRCPPTGHKIFFCLPFIARLPRLPRFRHLLQAEQRLQTTLPRFEIKDRY